jgi:hypothetical protein
MKASVSVKEISNGSAPDMLFRSVTSPLYQTFTINCYYLKQVHRLRVMKVMRCYDSPIYKVVLSSAVKSSGCACWLQEQSKSWNLLLGNEIDKKLIAAISSAIRLEG